MLTRLTMTIPLMAESQLCKRSVSINPNDRRGPWTEAPPSESGPLTLDIRGTSVTQLYRGFDEHDILEVPAPPSIDLHARHDTTVRDARTANVTSARADGAVNVLRPHALAKQVTTITAVMNARTCILNMTLTLFDSPPRVLVIPPL
jgi:hypothetical protein